MEKTVNTVNIIEINNGTILSIRSWIDNSQGNENAEDLFKDLIKSNSFNGSDKDLNCYIEDGVFNDCNGYECCIVHSS